MKLTIAARYVTFVLASILTTTFLPSANAATVYENGFNGDGTYGGNWFGTLADSEIGDEITLGGVARRLTQASIGAVSSGELQDIGMTLSLYAQDGPGGEPGTLIHRTATVPYDMPGGQALYEFTLPAVVVPDTFTWTIHFDRPDEPFVGLLRRSLSLVGTSPAHCWATDEFDEFYKVPSFSFPENRNFVSRFLAVPEPNVLALVVAGLLICGGRICR